MKVEEIDFIIKPEPWTEKDVANYRELMKNLEGRNKIKKPARPRKP